MTTEERLHMTKRIGLMVGREWSFPPAFMEEIDRRQAGVELVEESGVDGIDGDDSLDRDAGLAGGVVPASDDGVGGSVQVRVGSDHESRVRAQFEEDLGGRRITRDLMTDRGRTSEGHSTDPAIRGERRPDVRSTGDKLHCTLRCPRLE